MAKARAIRITNTKAVIFNAFFIGLDIGSQWIAIFKSGRNKSANITPERQEGKYRGRKPSTSRK